MRYLFKHVLLRDAAYEMQFGDRLRQMHCKAAEAIETIYAGDLSQHYADLVHHYHNAQDVNQEGQYAILAGRQAMQAYAYREAVVYFERALSLLPTGSREHILLFIQMGEALWYLGEYAQAQAQLQTGLAWGRQYGDDGRCADALIHLGGIARKQGDWTAARAYLAESLELAHRLGDQSKMAHALYALAWVDIRQGAYLEARARLAESQTLYRAAGEWEGLANTFNGLGTVALNLGKYEEAMSFYRESLTIYQDVSDRPGESAVLVNLGESARRQGDYAAARLYYQKSLVIDREIGDSLLAAMTLGNLGHTALACGDYTAAEKYYREGLQTAMSIGDIPGILDSLSGLAGVLSQTNRLEQALEVLGLALHHPALEDESRLVAEQALITLRAKLPPEAVEKGLARGRVLELEKVVKEILARPLDFIPLKDAYGFHS